MLHRSIITVAWILFSAVAPVQVFGWGSGHDYVNKLALTVMPPEIRSFLGDESAQKFVEWSHLPDDFTPWSELKHVTLCEEDKEFLESRDMKHPYSLHSHQGHAVNFILLIKSFQSKEPQRAALWMATLMHTVADELACNHDPLIHIMTYGFKEYGMDMGDGIGVDFADIAQTPQGNAVVQELLKGVKVVPVAEDAGQALLKVMMAGIEGNAYMTERGSRIAASYAAGASDTVRADSITAMAELGVQGVQESLNMILTAWELAQQSQLPELNDAVETKYKVATAEFGCQRTLRQDSLFAELLDAETGRQPYIGALVEPSVSMNQAKLGFSSKYIMASAVRTLRNHGKACRFVDLRSVGKNGFPPPDTMPLLMICAGSFNVSKEVQEQLAVYTQSGGKLLWIGGDHKDQLGALSRSMFRADRDLMPVSDQYGKDSPALKKAVIAFRSDFEKELGGQGYRFTHNPSTRAGWQKPICNYYIRGGDSNIVQLAQMTVDQSVMIIAAAYPGSDGEVQYLFLPEYLVSPYLLSDETAIKDPSQPVLDIVGTKILLASLSILEPDL